jgi:aspartate-semialdehyde dehydrogenase
MAEKYLGVIGATTEVGVRAIEELKQREMPLEGLRLFEIAAHFEKGKRVRVPHRFVDVEKFDPEIFSMLHSAIICVDDEFLREHGAKARSCGCHVFRASELAKGNEALQRICVNAVAAAV